MRVGIAAVAIGGAVLAARAEGKATGPVVVVVGEPRGFAPSERIDPARLGRAAVQLPGPGARQKWRIDLPVAIELPPMVDATGAVIAVAAGEAARVEADGRIAWRTRFSCAPSSSPPALTSAGAVAFLCSDGTLQRVAADGKLLPAVALHTLTLKSSCAPLARDDGSLVVAADEELIALGPGGAILARARLDRSSSGDHPVGGLIPLGDSVLVTLAGGDVWQWRAPLLPHKLGSFGGAVERGAALFGARALCAVVGRDRVVALDPVSRRTTVLADGGGTDGFEGPPALAPNGQLLVATEAGELVAIEETGSVARRVLIERAGAFASGALTAGSGLDGVSPPLVVDPRGEIAFARQSGRVGLVPASGPTHVLDPAVCAQPVALLPAGPGLLAVACSGGTIAMWGDK